jgi:hypothetical protein
MRNRTVDEYIRSKNGSISTPGGKMAQISRRDFLKVLGTVSLSPFVHLSTSDQREQAARLQKRKIYLQTVPIAGFYYYDGMDDDVYESLSIGDELELRREPQNPYDENAIEVYTREGLKLGYVPRINNPIPATLADLDFSIGAEIARMEDDLEEYPPVEMRLYLVLMAASEYE